MTPNPSPATLDPTLRSTHKRLTNEFPFFARHALSIKTKEGKIAPFILNSAQEYLHAQLEKQRAETGRVRALIVKGRQQGCSTYVGGRYYHRAAQRHGQSVFILSHEAETTKKLFRIVERYYDHTPEPIRPPAKIANKRELIFEALESDYAVGTAGNENVGRGGTIQLFHGSEVAFWQHTDQIQTGIIQSVPDLPETEVILESTANGMGNMFYQMCMDALTHDNDYIVVFIPWYWQAEYRRDHPHNKIMHLTQEEAAYKKLFSLDDQQMYWRRAKIAEFKHDLWKFKQEYPAFLQEAFQTSGETLISSERIMQARKSIVKDRQAPLVIGVDPGRNRDRTVFAYRRGREMLEPDIFTFDKSENVQMIIAGKIALKINTLNPHKVFVDVGHGYGIIDRLRETGYGDVVQGVNFGGEALEPRVYLNKRAEMWCNLRDWLHREDGEVSLPDLDVVQRDLVCMPDSKTTSSNKIQLVSKELIRKLVGMSPDIGDAMVLTFAYPIRLDGLTMGVSRRAHRASKQGKHPLTTLQRRDRDLTMNSRR